MNIKLTPEERGKLAEVIASPGWEVVKKLLTDALEDARIICEGAKDDVRFYQGQCAALRSVPVMLEYNSREQLKVSFSDILRY